MPHVARRIADSGFYHVVPKGLADQIIFEGDDDRALYLKLLSRAADRVGVDVIAYCLMSNHVHLILEDRNGQLSEAMKYLHERYAMHFAKVVGRTGGVFRKPYWSEPIESDAYLLCAVRYVHANPLAAGICGMSDYPWSSMSEYMGKWAGVAKTNLVLEMLGGKEGFKEFSQPTNLTAAPFPKSRLKGHLSDEEALRLVREVLGTNDVNLAKEQVGDRCCHLKLLRDRGFPIRQISRICGVSPAAIEKATL